MSTKSLELRLDNAERELAEIRKEFSGVQHEVRPPMYKSVPGRGCTGCAGVHDSKVCVSLPDCTGVIWVRDDS